MRAFDLAYARPGTTMLERDDFCDTIELLA